LSKTYYKKRKKSILNNRDKNLPLFQSSNQIEETEEYVTELIEKKDTNLLSGSIEIPTIHEKNDWPEITQEICNKGETQFLEIYPKLTYNLWVNIKQKLQNDYDDAIFKTSFVNFKKENATKLTNEALQNTETIEITVGDIARKNSKAITRTELLKTKAETKMNFAELKNSSKKQEEEIKKLKEHLNKAIQNQKNNSNKNEKRSLSFEYPPNYTGKRQKKRSKTLP